MALSNQEKLSLLALCAQDLFGYQVLFKLYTEFQSFQKIYDSNPDSWEQISPKTKNAWKLQKTQNNPDKIVSRLKDIQATFITYYDEEYPTLLKEISSPPLILYYQGELSVTETPCLAVVGTRMISPYGQQVIEEYIPSIVASGISIVSGFQRGVDQAAHKAALQYGGKTIAVLGAGLDIEYPSNSRQLRTNFLNGNGLIFSEYPLGTIPFKSNFPRRNRIVSGLSKAVMVVEAALNSGSMITPRMALEQDRDVYAVPGSIFSVLSQGPHHLIQQGAKCIRSPQDILSEFFNTSIQPTADEPALANRLQEQIYDLLKIRPYQLDELAANLGVAIDILSSELTLMDLAGMIHDTGDGSYRK
jgi:DNA processing protein